MRTVWNNYTTVLWYMYIVQLYPDRSWALTTELFNFKDNGCCSMGDEGRTCYPMIVHSAAGHTPGAGLREGSSSMDLLQERDQNTLRCLQFPERRLKKIKRSYGTFPTIYCWLPQCFIVQVQKMSNERREYASSVWHACSKQIQDCYRILVSLKSWPGQLLSLYSLPEIKNPCNPCLR